MQLIAKCVAAVCAAIVFCVTMAAAADQSMSGRLFVIDPGHGVRYPNGASLNVGAVGPTGVAEEAVALSVSERIARLLRARGARVALTRSALHPFRIATDRAADNRSRAALANALGATAFVAIHCDGSTDRARTGTSVFWWRANSSALADALRRHLLALGLGESQFRRRNLAVTDEARVPAALVELGFVSNPRQAALLADPRFQEREADAVVAALSDVFAAGRL